MKKNVLVWLFLSVLMVASCTRRVPETLEIEGFTLQGNVFSREVAANVTRLPLLIALYPQDDYQLYQDMARQTPIASNVVDLVKGKNTFYLEVTRAKAVSHYVINITVLPQDFVISYQSTGGTLIRSEVVKEGNVATKPNNPTRVGYHFVFWSTHPTQEIQYVFSTPVTQNLTLYAVWRHTTYTITFHTMGGNLIHPLEVPYLGSLSQLPTPTRTGHTFMGWTLDAAGLEPLLMTSMPAHSLNLYAKWSN